MYVNIWNSGGNLRVRKADASAGLEAHGFVLNNVGSGEEVQVYRKGSNPFVSSLTIGTQYFLGDGGAITSSVPAGSATGRVLQQVGIAVTTTQIETDLKDPVLRYT